jgi:hypothetical protein
LPLPSLAASVVCPAPARSGSENLFTRLLHEPLYSQASQLSTGGENLFTSRNLDHQSTSSTDFIILSVMGNSVEFGKTERISRTRPR